MKFLIVTDYFAIGGNATYIQNICKFLKKGGHQVILITYKSRVDSIESWKFTLNHYNIYIRDFRVRYLLHRAIGLYHLLKNILPKENPDAVISDLCLPAGSIMLCKLLMPVFRSIPFVYQFHGSNAYEKLSGEKFNNPRPGIWRRIQIMLHFLLLKQFETSVLNRTSAIIVFSEYSKHLLNKLRVNKNVYKLMPGSESMFKRTLKAYSKLSARNELGFSGTKKIILVVSRLDPRKGVFHLLHTLNLHRNIFTQAKVVLCSQFDSFFGKEILSAHSMYALGSCVILVNNPTIRDKALLYRAADVVLIPSLDLETFGFVALEAYTSGTPVIAYNSGAFGELVDQDWLVAPVGNGKKLLKETISLLSLSERKVSDMSSLLIKKSDNFSWTKYTNQLVNIAQTLLPTK